VLLYDLTSSLSLLKNKIEGNWVGTRRLAISRGSTLVAMMQTACLGEGNNIASGGKLYGARPWAVLVEREMRSGVMMILKNSSTERGADDPR
jgi:hypothetical protein